MGNFVIVGILVILMTILTYFGLDATGLATQMHPVAASAQAAPIDQLWHWEIMIICFLFSLIIVPMFYSLVIFRQKKGELKDGDHVTGNTTLEIAWTVIPLITVMILAYFGAYSLGEIRRVDPNAMVINVQAQQFSWTFEYPEYGFVSTELYLPLDKQVVLKMQSSDVIHSFWVPEFRVKQDVVPGRITEYRITPVLEGSYKVRCAELCGSSHAYMENPVIVVSAGEYDAWIAQQVKIAEESKTPEGLGKILSLKCIGCHSMDGPRMTGPTWFGLYGSEVTLTDGSTVTADDAYIAESILNPTAAVVESYNPVMPPFALSDEEISSLIAYIKTLK